MTGRTAQALAETVELIDRDRGRAFAIPGDVTAPDVVTRVVSTTESALGPIDILVNNAAVAGPLGYDWDVDATKAALTQWTKVLAEDTRGHGIAVFAFHPGLVRTPMLARAISASANVPSEVRDRFQTLLDRGRETPPDRAARMLLFLASGRADGLSGRFIRVQDSEEDLADRAEAIQRDDLYTVTLRT